MIGLLSSIITIACLPLPSEERQLYSREWTAELQCIAAENGLATAIGFVASLVLTVPRTAIALWDRPTNPFRETAIVMLTVFIPCLFFVGYGAVSRQPSLLLAHSVLLAGVFLISVGMCRNLRHPLHSAAARLGLALALAAGTSLTLINRLGDVSNPILEGTYRVYSGSSTTMVGFALLMLSGLIPNYRKPTIQVGLILVAAGTTAWGSLILVNIALASSVIEAIFQLVSAPALFAAAYAAWKAFHRDETYRAGVDAAG